MGEVSLDMPITSYYSVAVASTSKMLSSC